MRLNKRDWVYLTLLAFVAIGSVIDSVWQTYLHPYTLNDLVQMIGIVVFTAWWQIEDARMLGVRRGTATRILTILFMPVGLAIYLFSSRKIAQAVLVFLAFGAGLIAAVLAGTVLGDEILLRIQPG